MVFGIENLEVETNISNGCGGNKTKAEILYDLCLAIVQGGHAIHDNAIKYANTTYNALLNSEIIHENTMKVAGTAYTQNNSEKETNYELR